MSSSDRAFAGAIPDLYERLLVPLMFGPYAADLAERVAAARPREILETAAGTGALTRAMAERTGADVRIVATDLNQAMLDRAATSQNPGDRVSWQQMDATTLAFEDGRFDVVACQFGVMFFPDRRRAYAEARRVLAARGRFLFNVWDAMSRHPVQQALGEVLAAMFPDDPPDFMARVPHGYHDVDRVASDLQAAGFGDVAMDTVDKVTTAPSAETVATAFCQGTPWRAELEARRPGGLEAVTREAAEALGRRLGPGPITMPLRAIVVSAMR